MRRVWNVISIAGAATIVVFAALLWKSGALASQGALRQMLSGYGAAAAAVFTLIQAVQVVIPIIPGGVSCAAGIILFGPFKGFLCNYIGICLGSLAAFMIAKHYGKPALEKIFSRKQIEKYEKWTAEKGRFAKIFAVAIFLPVAPDDFLCYLAGTTDMSFRSFAAIIFLGKPGSIALYSIGLAKVLSRLTALIAG